jgi:3',5'-cyclic AMP phosphodiesterase CpdA
MFFLSKVDDFEPKSPIQLLLRAPLRYPLRLLWRLSNLFRSSPAPKAPPVRIVCISDTHTNTYDIPSGDVLIHAGDLTNAGNIEELQAQIDWLASLPHKHKIAIAGNHDTWLDPRSRTTLPEADKNGALDWKDVHYLQHCSLTLTFPPSRGYGTTEARKLRVYGAPQIPACGGSEFAFQYKRGQDAWSETIPDDTDILVTHTPPKYHRDLMVPSMGCEHLLDEVWRVKPILHVFAHVHAGAGQEVVWWDEAQKAYEIEEARTRKSFVGEVMDIRTWTAMIKVMFYGATGLLWNRVWGGEQRNTIMVNAALMVNNTGQLGNRVQIVDI